jgi:integrase/recombinase XerC
MSNVTYLLPGNYGGSPLSRKGEVGGSMPQCLERHLSYLRQRGLSENTIYQRSRAMHRLRGHLGIDLFTATPDMLADWRAGLVLGDQGIKCEVSHIRQFYAWALANGLVQVNPADRLPVPKLGRRIPRPIGDDRLMYALATAPPRVRPWLVLAGWAGLRAKEIAYLRRSSVLENAAPPVLLIATDATKGRSERIVPMSPFVRDELMPLLPGASGYLFRRLDGARGPNMPGLVSKLANEHLHGCGYPETLHQLRHRFGTGTYRQSRDLRVVQELLGHSSPATTAGYAAYDQADAVAAVQGLPAPRRLRAVSK